MNLQFADVDGVLAFVPISEFFVRRKKRTEDKAFSASLDYVECDPID